MLSFSIIIDSFAGPVEHMRVFRHDPVLRFPAGQQLANSLGTFAGIMEPYFPPINPYARLPVAVHVEVVGINRVPLFHLVGEVHEPHFPHRILRAAPFELFVPTGRRAGIGHVRVEAGFVDVVVKPSLESAPHRGRRGKAPRADANVHEGRLVFKPEEGFAPVVRCRVFTGQGNTGEIGSVGIRRVGGLQEAIRLRRNAQIVLEDQRQFFGGRARRPRVDPLAHYTRVRSLHVHASRPSFPREIFGRR